MSDRTLLIKGSGSKTRCSLLLTVLKTDKVKIFTPYNSSNLFVGIKIAMFLISNNKEANAFLPLYFKRTVGPYITLLF